MSLKIVLICLPNFVYRQLKKCRKYMSWKEQLNEQNNGTDTGLSAEILTLKSC